MELSNGIKMEKEDLKSILEEIEGNQELNPEEALSLIAQKFIQPYLSSDLLSTLTELQNKEIISIARLYPVIQQIEEHYEIITPIGEFIRWVMLGRISKYRRGRKEILDLVGRLTGFQTPTEEYHKSLLKRLFGKE